MKSSESDRPSLKIVKPELKAIILNAFFIETPLDPCSPNPCQNDGTCSGNSYGFTCSCASGYTGDDCSTNGIADC